MRYCPFWTVVFRVAPLWSATKFSSARDINFLLSSRDCWHGSRLITFLFYLQALFSNPTMLLCSLLGLQISLVAFQLMILLHTIEWYQVLSMTLLTVTNYYTLFKLARDYLICWKVYRAEQIVQEKAQTALSNATQ